VTNTTLDRATIERHLLDSGVTDLLARLAEVDRRYEAEAAEQDRRLAECLELARRPTDGRVP
jgi:tRNA A37 N6-isopentenylltransferase MiaA